MLLSIYIYIYIHAVYLYCLMQDESYQYFTFSVVSLVMAANN